MYKILKQFGYDNIFFYFLNLLNLFHFFHQTTLLMIIIFSSFFSGESQSYMSRNFPLLWEKFHGLAFQNQNYLLVLPPLLMILRFRLTFQLIFYRNPATCQKIVNYNSVTLSPLNLNQTCQTMQINDLKEPLKLSIYMVGFQFTWLAFLLKVNN